MADPIAERLVSENEPVTSKLFLLDDVTPFGVDRARVDILTKMLRDPPVVLDGQALASQLAGLIPRAAVEAVTIGYGGVLTYTLLARNGLDLPFKMLNVERKYLFVAGQKRPKITCTVSGDPDLSGRVTPLLIDDVIASGQTMYRSSLYLRNDSVSASALVISGDTRNIWRSSSGSSVNYIDTVYASQIVNGAAGFPAILSLRYVLLKTRTKESLDYFIQKYAKEEAMEDLGRFLRRPAGDVEEMRLLYSDPDAFVKRQSQDR